MNEDKATRYHRRKRQTRCCSIAWGGILLAGLLVSGSSAGLRNLAWRVASPAPVAIQEGLVVLLYTACLIILLAAGDLPIAFYGEYLLEHRYGLSRQAFRSWLADQLKSVVVQVLLGSAAATTVYFFIRRFPDSWWLPAGATFAVLVCVLANLGPVVLLPLFYRLKPLARESLRGRLMALADRAGARVLGAYEWGLSEKTRMANAALTGLGRTKRILVSDTMLADYSDDEIEIVLAHELAHHVHGDIWRTLGLESALVFAGLYLSAQVLELVWSAAGLESAGDVAGLPILLLAVAAVSVAALPAAHAASRALERRADRFALRLTRNPAAFVSAMRRLAAQNLAEEHPTKLAQWLFYTHPPIRERIAAAELFAKTG